MKNSYSKSGLVVDHTYSYVRRLYVRLCTYIVRTAMYVHCTYEPVRPKNFHCECYPYQIRMYGLVRTMYVQARTYGFGRERERENCLLFSVVSTAATVSATNGFFVVAI